MTKDSYLSLRGFDKEAWDVYPADKCVRLLAIAGHQNNMFGVTEAKAIKEFGKGSYIVKIGWYDLNEGEQIQAVPSPPPPVPNVPPMSGMIIPDPPKPQVSESDIEDAEIVEEVVMSSFLKSRIANLEKFGWVDSGVCLDKDGKSIFYKDLEEMENDEYMPMVMVKAPPVPEMVLPTPVILGADSPEEAAEVMKNLQDAGMAPKPIEPKEEFICDRYDATGVICDEQCNFCKKAENSGMTTAELKANLENAGQPVMATSEITAKQIVELNDNPIPIVDPVIKAQKDLKKIVEASGAPAENVIVASVPPIVDTNLDADEAAETIEEEDEYDETKSEARKKELELVGAIRMNDHMAKGDEKITFYDMYETPKKEWKAVLNKFASIELVEPVKEISKKETPVEKKKTDVPKKETPKAPVVEKPKRKLKPVPSASEETIGQFKLVEELMEVFDLFKKQSYTLASIEDILSSDDIAEDVKIIQIRNAIYNITK